MNEKYIINTVQNGHVPPEAFLYLDRNGYIQNENGIPIFYHIYRRANNQMTIDNRRFDINIYLEDKNILPNLNINKYWWLTE